MTFIEQQQRAREAYRRALATGELIRATACEMCGEDCHPDGHHHNGYSDEHALDVVWLCRSCHKKVHHASDELREARRRGELRPTDVLHIRMDPDVQQELADFCAETRRNRTDAVNYVMHDWFAMRRASRTSAVRDPKPPSTD